MSSLHCSNNSSGYSLNNYLIFPSQTTTTTTPLGGLGGCGGGGGGGGGGGNGVGQPSNGLPSRLVNEIRLLVQTPNCSIMNTHCKNTTTAAEAVAEENEGGTATIGRDAYGHATLVGVKQLLEKEKDITILNIFHARLEKPLVNRCAKDLSWRLQHISEIEGNIIWLGNAISDSQYLAFGSKFRVMNRFPSMQELVRKRWLARILKCHGMLQPSKVHFFPETHFLPEDLETVRRCLSTVRAPAPLFPTPSSYTEVSSRPMASVGKRERGTVYILKPDAGAQGVGLKLVNRIEDIPANILWGANGYIIQKYIANPMRVQNKKFDIRVYVLITKVYPELEAYIACDSLVRFCTVNYASPDRSNFDNPYMHYTNFSINRENEGFVQSIDIHDPLNSKRHFDDVLRDLSCQGYNPASVWSQIIVIVQETVMALQPLLALTYRYIFKEIPNPGQRCFQILGFDILLDDLGRAWLLEVNSNPSLRTECSLAQQKQQQQQPNAIRKRSQPLSPHQSLAATLRLFGSSVTVDSDIVESPIDHYIKYPLLKEALSIAEKRLLKPFLAAPSLDQQQFSSPAVMTTVKRNNNHNSPLLNDILGHDKTIMSETGRQRSARITIGQNRLSVSSQENIQSKYMISAASAKSFFSTRRMEHVKSIGASISTSFSSRRSQPAPSDWALGLDDDSAPPLPGRSRLTSSSLMVRESQNKAPVGCSLRPSSPPTAPLVGRRSMTADNETTVLTKTSQKKMSTTTEETQHENKSQKTPNTNNGIRQVSDDLMTMDPLRSLRPDDNKKQHGSTVMTERNSSVAASTEIMTMKGKITLGQESPCSLQKMSTTISSVDPSLSCTQKKEGYCQIEATSLQNTLEVPLTKDMCCSFSFFASLEHWMPIAVPMADRQELDTGINQNPNAINGRHVLREYSRKDVASRHDKVDKTDMPYAARSNNDSISTVTTTTAYRSLKGNDHHENDVLPTCWSFVDQALERHWISSASHGRLISSCRELFEVATHFPQSAVLKFSHWEHFCIASGLRKIIATVTVPCLVNLDAGSSLISTPLSTMKKTSSIAALERCPRIHVSRNKTHQPNNSRLPINTDKAKTSATPSLLPTNKQQPTDVNRWYLELPSRSTSTRPMSWPDLKWLYYRPFRSIAMAGNNASRHSVVGGNELDQNKGLGFWSFWELLLQIAALLHTAEAARRREECLNIGMTAVSSRQGLSRFLAAARLSRDVTTNHLGDGQVLPLRKETTAGPPPVPAGAGIDVKKRSRRLDLCASRVLDWWPDTGKILRKVLELDPENLGYTVERLCQDLLEHVERSKTRKIQITKTKPTGISVGLMGSNSKLNHCGVGIASGMGVTTSVIKQVDRRQGTSGSRVHRQYEADMMSTGSTRPGDE